MKYNPQKQKQLLDSIRNQDWDTFKQIRFKFSSDGIVYCIEDLDLSGCQLGDIPSDFLCFKNCNLDNASFQGKQFWPTSLWKCSAKNIDLRRTYGMLLAVDTDFSGAKFDQTSVLYPHWHTDLPSSFKNCQIDADFSSYLAKIGCKFDMDDNDFEYGFVEEIFEPIKRKGEGN